MKRLFFVLMILVFCFSTEGFAATLINDNFDSYTAGSFPPSPWFGAEFDGSASVNNSVYYSSPNSVAFTAGDACTGSPYIEQIHPDITGSGTYEAYLRTNNVSHETLIMASEGVGSVDGLGFWLSLGGPASSGIPVGHFAWYDGTNWHDVTAISNDTWYHIKIAVNVPSKTYYIYVDDMTTPIVTGATFRDTTLTALASVAFETFCSGNPNPPIPGEDYAYVDNVIVSSQDPPASIPTMTEWGMIIFILLAGLGAVYFIRRQRRAER